MKFFEQFINVIAVMSLKADGDLRVKKGKEIVVNPMREIFFKKIEIEAQMIKSALMKDAAEVAVVYASSPTLVKDADALVTKEKGIFLEVRVKDCHPVLFYDSISGVIGIAHAGWKGIAGNIVSKSIKKMEKLGAKREQILAVIGPGICQIHYPFDIVDAKKYFPKYCTSEFMLSSDNKYHINLPAIIVVQLKEAGVFEENIEVVKSCTVCSDKFSSHRRDGQDAGNMSVIIGMKKCFYFMRA